MTTYSDPKVLEKYFQNTLWNRDGNHFNLLGPNLNHYFLENDFNSKMQGFDFSYAKMLWSYHEKKSGYNLCFEDTWTLLFWTEFLRNRPNVKKINIIHLDDHMDLMAPLIFQREHRLFDITTDQNVDLMNADDTRRLIERGNINLSSFIVPILHLIERVDIFHLKKQHLFRKPLRLFLDREYISAYPYQEKNRISASFRRYETDFTAGSFSQSNDIRELLDTLDDSLTFLHIDLDYFINYYNGTRKQSDAEYEFSNHLIRKEIENIALYLNDISNICDITICTSPGFCPVKDWHWIISELLGNLNLKIQPL